MEKEGVVLIRKTRKLITDELTVDKVVVDGKTETDTVSGPAFCSFIPSHEPFRNLLSFRS